VRAHRRRGRRGNGKRSAAEVTKRGTAVLSLLSFRVASSLACLFFPLHALSASLWLSFGARCRTRRPVPERNGSHAPLRSKRSRFTAGGPRTRSLQSLSWLTAPPAPLLPQRRGRRTRKSQASRTTRGPDLAYASVWLGSPGKKVKLFAAGSFFPSQFFKTYLISHQKVSLILKIEILHTRSFIARLQRIFSGFTVQHP
jgi:hypothetical protein